ncbi:hypothetical protein Tco_1246299 [Tanacetum coccineum]
MCFLSILSDRGGLVNASRAKRAAKTHDPLALVANTYASSSSSRSPPAYYVTHPPLEIDYDDDYQGEAICDDQEDSLTTAMMLLACAITQRYYQFVIKRIIVINLESPIKIGSNQESIPTEIEIPIEIVFCRVSNTVSIALSNNSNPIKIQFQPNLCK